MRTQSKIYPSVFFFQVNILLLDNKFSHCLFITDYMTVAENVDIVAKYVFIAIHHIFIAPAYSRVRYRSSNFRPSLSSSVRSFIRQHLRRSLVFSTSVIAASLKPCIVIVLDMPFKHAP